MTIQTYDMDTPNIRVPVTIEPGGGAFDLSGAAVEAWAKRHGGGVVSLDATVTDAGGGIITVSVGANDLDRGTYTMQVRVTKAMEVQTVLEACLNVQCSISGGGP